MSNKTIVGCLFAVSLLLANPLRADERWFDRGSLPSGFAIGDGAEPLQLTVAVKGDALSSSPTAEGQSADVEAKRSSQEGMTLLIVSNAMDRELKYDLYISPDGEHFLYTSTCAVIAKGKNFESWPYRIKTFAIGNARAAATHTCD